MGASSHTRTRTKTRGSGFTKEKGQTLRLCTCFAAHVDKGGDGTSSTATEEDPMKQKRCMLCTSVTASSVTGCLQQISKAAMQGVDIVELRLDYLTAAAEEGEEGVSGP